MRSSTIATLHYGRHFPTGEFQLVSQMAHCDGLVLLPTNTNTYIFNPATRDVIALPDSQHNVLQHRTCLPIGFGLDASTGKYKVARAFYRAFDYDSISMGMEVFTINGQDRSWTPTLMDPPYLIRCPQTAIYCKGCLFYFIDKGNQRYSPRGLIRFSLEDETFGITPLLNNVFPIVEDEDIVLHELDGELCATFVCESLQRVLVYMTKDILDPEWHRCYIINVSNRCQPMASLTNGRILIRENNCLFSCYKDAHGITHSVNEDRIFDIHGLRFLGPNEDTVGYAWKDLYWLDLLSYTESLVPVTPKASLHAS
jgi:F-box interacting protein